MSSGIPSSPPPITALKNSFDTGNDLTIEERFEKHLTRTKQIIVELEQTMFRIKVKLESNNLTDSQKDQLTQELMETEVDLTQAKKLERELNLENILEDAFTRGLKENPSSANRKEEILNLFKNVAKNVKIYKA